MTNSLGIENRIAVVTGASSGIGRATAIEFARAGSHVAIHTNRSLDAAKQLASELNSYGVDSAVFCADFSQVDHVQFVDQIWNWKNRVDFWINNAGADVLTNEKADWSLIEKLRHLMTVDVESTWLLSRAVGARMDTAGSGREDQLLPCIINIGWDQAWQGMAGDSGELFSITKGSVMALTKSLAQSLAPNVRVNCVAPGWIRTAWGDSTSEYWNWRAMNDSLLKRWGRAEDVATAIVGLAGRPGQFINAQVIPVNGGFENGG